MQRRKPGRGSLKLTGARENNLQNVTVGIPIGTLTVVTGVSRVGQELLDHRYACPGSRQPA